MPAPSARLDRLVASLVRRPRRRMVLLLVSGVCVLLAVALHTTAYLAQEPLPGLLRALLALAVGGGFGGLGLVAVHALGRSAEPRPRVLWVLVVAVGVAGVVGSLMGWWLVPAELAAEERATFGFLKNGAPRGVSTLALMVAASATRFVLALFLLVRLRDFVLWRRTSLAARHWRWMLAGFVTVAALHEALGGWLDRPAGDTASTLLSVAVALLIGLNVARLSWIVYLSFREKLWTLLFSSLLLVAIAASSGMRTSVLLSGDYGFATSFSRGLDAFTGYAFAFAAVYAASTFLLTLFHLPTSTDFERRQDERNAFNAFNRLIGQAFDTDQLGQAIVDTPVKGGAADRAWLVLVDDATLAPRVVAAAGVPVEDAARVVDAAAFLADAADTPVPVQLDEALADLRVRHRVGVPVGSLLAVPLAVRDDVLGVLFATRAEPFGFTSDDRRTLQGLAAQASLALDHSRLFESRVEKERLQRELDIARAVQQRLLPQQLPRVPRLGLCATSVPALEVGGDYYDALVLDDGRLGVIVADVSGKGTSAAFYMAELKGVFRALAHGLASPAAFLNRAHRALTVAPGTFVSALYVLFDPATATATLARAGHCPALLVPGDGGPATTVNAPGLALGMDHGGAFARVLTDVTVRLAPGDRLVLYTDGVVESRNPQGEEYGYERLAEAVAAHPGADAAALHAAVLDDLHAFLQGEPYADDLTLFVLAWMGHPSEVPLDADTCAQDAPAPGGPPPATASAPEPDAARTAGIPPHS